MKITQLTILFILCAAPVFADQAHHHEELTAAQLGTVHFPVSCSPGVQKSFERGVALLHSFWYEQAETTFEQVGKEDPRCAMAHWGIGMSLWHQLWNHPDDATLKRGASEARIAKAFHPANDRERDYTAALAAFYLSDSSRKYESRATSYSKAMQKVYERNPDDHEAAAFYALSLLAAEPSRDPNNANRKKAAVVLEKVFAAEPNHPGVAHYLIHTYDTAEMAELGVPAARRYAQTAPAAPHALHMPSHIFARLGLWQDDINSNVASIAASRKYAEMGGEGHEFHAMDFLFYAYLQTGREDDAKKLLDEVKAMPPMKDMYGMGFDPHISSLVVFEAMYPLELHRWQEAADLSPVAGASAEDQSITHWARAIGFAHLGKLAEVRTEVGQIEAIRQKLIAEKKSKSTLDAIEQDQKEAKAWEDFADGKIDQALSLLKPFAEKATGVLEASDQIPAREMMGDMLLEKGHPAEALTEYEAASRTDPNRFNSLYGIAASAQRSGNPTQAAESYAKMLKSCEGSDSTRPELGEAKSWLAKHSPISTTKTSENKTTAKQKTAKKKGS
jgi:tetratricopeptide (TPR) repeat protein